MTKSKNMHVMETDEARELALYTENNFELYRRALPIIANLNRKVKRGVYDAEKAIDAFYPLTTEAAKMYSREFGHFHQWNTVFDVTARYTAAAEMVEFFADMIHGNV